MGDTADLLEATGFNSIEDWLDSEDTIIQQWYAWPIKCIWDDLPIDTKEIAKLDGFHNYFFKDHIKYSEDSLKGFEQQCCNDLKEWISEWDFENADYMLAAMLEMDWLHSQSKFKARLEL